MKTNVAIVGGGPGGAAMAIRAMERGLRPVIIEKETFPRYHIGESFTGECGECVRALGLEQRMIQERHPIKYGVKVYGPGGVNSFYVPVTGRSPEGEQSVLPTWQVRRSKFDHMILEEALRRGAEIL